MIEFVKTINFYLSDYVLVFLLLGTGIFYSVRTKFVQIRCFKEGVKKVLGSFSLNGGKQKKGMSSFQALATAVSAQVGTGNIVGSCLSNDLVWELTDFFNQLMVIPNIMALIALSSDVISVSLEEHE